MKLSDAAQEFIDQNGPFQAARRLPSSQFSGWAVRTPIGEDVALCDNEDWAFGISEALNAMDGEHPGPDSKTMNTENKSYPVATVPGSAKRFNRRLFKQMAVACCVCLFCCLVLVSLENRMAAAVFLGSANGLLVAMGLYGYSTLFQNNQAGLA